MKMKKTLTAVVAMALVAAVSVAGTMAYLTQKTGLVTNTFTAGSLGKDMQLELWENPVKADTAGVYHKNGETHVNGNTYDNLLPNSTNDKNPTVTVSNLSTDAYLFIEVVNDETDSIEATVGGNWNLLKDNAEGGSKIYVYAKDGGIVHATKNADVDTPLNVEVLQGNTFKVKDFTDAKEAKFTDLTVKAYICQAAGFDSAEAAWNGAFGAKA